MKNEPHLKKVVPINTVEDGTARTLKSQYYKTGFANFFRTDGFGATGVLICSGRDFVCGKRDISAKLRSD